MRAPASTRRAGSALVQRVASLSSVTVWSNMPEPIICSTSSQLTPGTSTTSTGSSPSAAMAVESSRSAESVLEPAGTWSTRPARSRVEFTGGDPVRLTTTLATSFMYGREKSTIAWRSSVTVRSEAATSPFPAIRSGSSRPNGVGMKTTRRLDFDVACFPPLSRRSSSVMASCSMPRTSPS
jgi:hypothetical protein